MSATKLIVFRVSGLPGGSEREVTLFLEKALALHTIKDPDDLKRRGKITIVPSCYVEKTSVALLDWKEPVPKFLAKLSSKGSIERLVIEVDDRDLTFDRHFHGFTQMYSTSPGATITADIIAMTGLNGHPYGSFTAPGFGRMWLRHFLRDDLPNCRTMTYGYNARVLSRGIDSIMSYGQGLLEAMKTIRQSEDTVQRPIFFIAHSFGGIVAAQGLVKASSLREDEDEAIVSIYKSIFAFFFYGTPHEGMIVDNIREMIADDPAHPRHTLIKDIEEKSSLLQTQLVFFKNAIRGRRIVSFYEVQQTQKLTKEKPKGRMRSFLKDLKDLKIVGSHERSGAEGSTNSKGHTGWSKSGDYTTIVEPQSAALWLPDSMEIKIPLSQDHSTMVKFDSRHADGYTTTLSYIRQFEKEAPKFVRDRFFEKSIVFKPFSMIPFKKDPDFVGRERVLQTLHDSFSSVSHTRCALAGLAGMGKSQIAIEYSYRLRLHAPQTCVFWVHATDPTKFEQSYRDIAARLKLPGHDNPKSDILKLVSDWLADESNGPWLLILDAADDVSMFTHRISTSGADQKVNLRKYVPEPVTGSVLVTSRDKRAAFSLVGNHKAIFPITQMTSEEAMMLLKKKLPPNQRDTDCSELLTLLDNIPLAITQAAAYICKGEESMSVSKYVELFNESAAHRSNLLDEDESDLRRNPDVPNSVITTWQISFTKVRKQAPSAADLLSLMSVLHRQQIPAFLVSERIGHNKTTFQAALNVLLTYSLITAHTGGELFEIHRLVQLATKKWLVLHNETGKWSIEALGILSEMLPEGNFENWKKCGLLLPHAEAVLEYNFEEPKEVLQTAMILQNWSWYLWEKGDFKLSRDKVEHALKIRSKYLDETDDQLLESFGQYGNVLLDEGEYSNAEAILRKVVDIRTKVHGVRHPDSLKAMSNLASVLDEQGRYDEAVKIHREVLKIREETLGPKHEQTLITMGNLALVLTEQHNYEEAEVLQAATLRLREEVLGTDHPHTIAAMDNMAHVLGKGLGRYKEAEAILRKELEILKKGEVGEKHYLTTTAIHNLAFMLQHQGKYEEAELQYRESLVLKEDLLGPTHRSTINTVRRLAQVMQSLKRVDEASVLYERASSTYETLLGPDHEDTIACFQEYSLMLADSKSRISTT